MVSIETDGFQAFWQVMNEISQVRRSAWYSHFLEQISYVISVTNSIFFSEKTSKTCMTLSLIRYFYIIFKQIPIFQSLNRESLSSSWVCLGVVINHWILSGWEDMVQCYFIMCSLSSMMHWILLNLTTLEFRNCLVLNQIKLNSFRYDVTEKTLKGKSG